MTSQPGKQTHIEQYFKKSYQTMKFGLFNLIEYNDHTKTWLRNYSQTLSKKTILSTSMDQ